MVQVRVPATSANLGAGFDCFGIALSMYNTISVSETEKGLYIVRSPDAEYTPNDKNNLIYRSVMRAFDEVDYTPKGLKISQKSDIPMTRGLGSSSSCIVGGLIAGNIISGRKLTPQRIFELANEIEGHPDNVAPALYGGFCVSCIDNGTLFRRTVRPKNDIKFVAMIPKYFVPTKKSRTQLPKTVLAKDAAFNVAHASMLALSFASGDYRDLDVFVNDRLHQPYRAAMIEDMEKIFGMCSELGALASYLSGSGPTVIAIIKAEDTEFIKKTEEYFKSSGIDRRLVELSIDNVGAVAIEKGI